MDALTYDARGLVAVDGTAPGIAEIDGTPPNVAEIEDGRATFDARDLTIRKINAELRRLLYEADDLVALASEEIAIRAVIDHEIDTYDPFEGEVLVWQR